MLGLRSAAARWIAARSELVRANAPIYVEHGQAINRVAARARMLVVAEPCNTNCLVAMQEAPNVPHEHWFALNRLDRMRATALIAEKARVPVSQVNRVTVWGNHSEKIFVDFHNAFIGDRPACQVITDPQWPREVLEPAVARRESEVFRNCAGRRRRPPPSRRFWERSARSRTRLRLAARFGAAVVPTAATAFRRAWYSAFRCGPRTDDTWSIVEGLYLDDYASSRLAENIDDLDARRWSPACRARVRSPNPARRRGAILEIDLESADPQVGHAVALDHIVQHTVDPVELHLRVRVQKPGQSQGGVRQLAVADSAR